MAKTPNIPELQLAYHTAYTALAGALKAKYPIGTFWLVCHRSGQKVPSLMSVCGHDPGWPSRVRFCQDGRPKKFGYGTAPTFRCYVPLDRIQSRA
jgi:hypothetical protein